MSTDQQTRLRQFYVRVLLSFAIVWGAQLLITAPFIFRGATDSKLGVIAVLLNSLTISPACVLAFWHRRTACVWLTVNALVIAIATVPLIRQREVDVSGLAGVAVPVIIALLLDYSEWMSWPPAVRKRDGL